MATEKETIILDLKVDQGSAISELEKTKKVIIGVKEEQQQLTKAYKAGEVAVDEYASESVRLEGILKKSQSEYNNIQKSVTGVKTQMDKLIDSNKKISSEFQNAANNIRVAGVSVGDLTTKLAAFAHPAVAVVGVVTALGAAYANSTVGAKDLSFASNQLSSAMSLLINDFGRLISSAEDGEGLISKGTNFLIESFGNYLARGFGSKLAAESKQLALIQEQLEDLQREEISVRSVAADRLGDNQEMLTTISLEQTTLNEKVHLYGEIIGNITKNEDELVDLKKRQLAFVNEQLAKDQENETLQTAQLNVKREIANIEKDADRKRQAIQRQEDNLLDTERKKTFELREQQRIQARRIGRGLTATDSTSFGGQTAEGQIAGEVDVTKAALNKIAQFREESREKEKDARDKATEEFIADQETRLLAASAASQALTTLAVTAFGENSAIAKATGITEAIVNTYTGATLALRSTPPPLSFALAALTIANGLASVAQITRAAGGGDFVTKGPALMMVGDNPGGRERVTVEPLSGRGQTRVSGNRIAMAGGGTLTTGFDDGGIVRNGATAQMQQAIMFTNAIKNLPPNVTSWREWADVNDRMISKTRVAEA